MSEENTQDISKEPVQQVFEMYVHTSPFLRDKDGYLVNENGETLHKVSIDELSNEAREEVLRNETLRNNTSPRKHVLVNSEGKVCSPAPNPTYNRRRVTVCGISDLTTGTTSFNFSVCRESDIALSMYKKSRGNTIAKGRAKVRPILTIQETDRKAVIERLFNILNGIHWFADLRETGALYNTSFSDVSIENGLAEWFAKK